ncbi:MAG: ATP-binding protein [Pseudomonadota bacterium]|uniref:ATP-binding protein n=1 Tax=Gallaecimonas pentaromativorans TaxID=584787 RepID=UPI00067F5ED0|nr:ATP-binding protein [Gallaecimonas pentaromativorans]MED5525423.1 ATP-binding protein [Pseudomonadota bacterium]
MSINVGEVVSVRGTQITLTVHEESNLETLFYNGKKFKGISIREYIGIKRGFCIVVCNIEGEYLDEKLFEAESNRIRYIRKVEVKPIGYIERDIFFDGIKVMPMIKDQAYLLSESQISKIFSQDNDGQFSIGSLLKEDVRISLPWEKLFNSHIGIFGNTGSGKSNTLTKIYTELFRLFEQTMTGKSSFLLIDFNGEYTGNQLISDENNKKTYNLSTRTSEGGDKFPLPSSNIWNTEILSLLFQATANTQTPFINRVVEGRERYNQNPNSLENYLKKIFEKCFSTTSQRRESLSQLKVIAKKINCTNLENELDKIYWYNNGEKYYHIHNGIYRYFNGSKEEYNQILGATVNAITISNIDAFDELIVRINLQLLGDMALGYVQYEHIQPLLKRVESAIGDLKKVITVSDDLEVNILNVISLRDCNQSTKKIFPLLLAKMFYQSHRYAVQNPPNKTLHFIIDEAHNILSQQSSREHETWKDYRLEMFEEIIKEGRKFGMYLTLSSQRPADISPTIMSQIHNFFIHRLVNEKDLFLIDNTISTLDRMSKSLIPNLSKGCCIVTGTAFDIPITMQVDKLVDGRRPDSDDVDIKLLWSVD